MIHTKQLRKAYDGICFQYDPLFTFDLRLIRGIELPLLEFLQQSELLDTFLLRELNPSSLNACHFSSDKVSLCGEVVSNLVKFLQDVINYSM